MPGDVPPGLRRLLRRCLEKEPKRRLRDIGDGLAEIEEASRPPSSAPAAPVPMRPLRIALFFVGLGLGLLFGALMSRFTVVDAATSYFSMTLVFAGLGILLGHKLATKQS